MDATLVRTSVTVDEAVAILLGWAVGPILFTSSKEDLSEEEQDLLDSASFSLSEELEYRQSVCEFDLDDAKDDGSPESAIAEKRAALEKHSELAKLASTYLCAINDEVNKGDSSGLREDRALSNRRYTYVTLTSLDEWAQGRYGKAILQQNTCSVLATIVKKKAPKAPRTKMRDQEAAILREIAKQGYSPKHLPLTVSSIPGAKAAVKGALVADPLFTGKLAFKRAWDQLRKDGSIADAERL